MHFSLLKVFPNMCRLLHGLKGVRNVTKCCGYAQGPFLSLTKSLQTNLCAVHGNLNSKQLREDRFPVVPYRNKRLNKRDGVQGRVFMKT